jgi:hypothetical protein
LIFTFRPDLFSPFVRQFPFPFPNVVFDAFDARMPGAIGTAEKVFFRLDAVSDDFAAAMSADRRKAMNRAFKTIEDVTISRRYDLKRQVIIVTANFALRHITLLRRSEK